MNGVDAANHYGVDVRFAKAIDNYVQNRWKAGGFINAILENDLVETMNRAHDEETRNAIPAILMYIYNELPGTSWGSKSKVKLWLEEEAEWKLKKFSKWTGETRAPTSID